ncbi:DUF4082 domain-containing protein [Actinoplanes derwentensis]|uniref:Ig-like domain-containing protein n=1 Tax=Actinoplanes derwentensis TaxID=113562 RepID=A0A1H2BBL7_9ACTN|nr:DUF4082 domain-containing protein [Actinoplanes derwentensis]SDT55621.1 Ig-like domain-containing protein [Actinoplanes derwentensis]
MSIFRAVATRPWRRPTLAAIAALLVVITSSFHISPVYAADPCAAPVNAIACENTKTGVDPAVWDNIWGAGDPSIQGFTTDISVNVGQTVNFKVRSEGTYRIDIYRLGYYGGSGARLYKSIENLPTNLQGACVTDPTTEIYDCGQWTVTASWAVPSDTVSGVFTARLTRDGDQGASQIPFVVRNDASTSKLYFKTSDATWQAYNTFGGSNFYWGGPMGRALKVSYNRPWETRNVGSGRDFVFSNEFPMIKFLERNGYDVSYTTDVDADRRGQLIRNHQTFLSVGHDEYWSGPQRAHVEAARDAGVNLAFFSGNEVYWKTRWESSVDGTNSPYRTLVCYKETWAGAKIDPSAEWTGTWRDPQFSPPSNGNKPENALTGTAYMSNNTDLAMKVPAAQGNNRFWRNTDAYGQSNPNGVVTLAPHTVGYESDEDLDNGFRPAGLIRLSTTTGPSPEYLQDFGLQVAPGTTTHHMTLYKAPSGALVFGAGTIQWAWGLDQSHDSEDTEQNAPADRNIQQATVNLLADMGAPPTTLMTGLVASPASGDVVAPDTTITSPAAGTKEVNGTTVTVTGTAVDSGGGQVAAVEVSEDGGDTWHPADGTSTWTYSTYSHGAAAQVLKARAVDDSGNIETSPASLTLDLTGTSTLFGKRVPEVAAADDGSAVTLGVRFTPQTAGNITGVRFYKGPGNTGTHRGAIWSSTGEQLRGGTFTDESASGWQTLKFSSPLQVTANTTYTASYYAPNGRYAADERFFSSLPWTRYPLVAPRGTSTTGNGVFRTGNGFPVENSRTSANYYVDVLFVDGDTAPPSVLVTTPEDTERGLDLDANLSALFSKPLNGSTAAVTLTGPGNTTVAGTTSYDGGTRTVTFNPTANLTAGVAYTATVTAQDTQGRPMSEPYSWTFTTTAYDDVKTLMPLNALPQNASSGDGSEVNLGVKFSPAVDGEVIGVRYYQGPGNTGAHIGTLYKANGEELAKATFGAGTGSGWQKVFFAEPVPVTAGQTYVASYWASNGNYSYNPGFFNEAYTTSDRYLTAPAGANGLYKYGADDFPTADWNSTNYWVDPLFVTDEPAPPLPTQPDPPAGASTLLGSTTPVVPAFNDGSAIEVGARFSSSVAGTVRGLRFYKGEGNGGAHTGTLWSAGGTELAQGTFQHETATGWQTLIFDEPVPITANTSYVASYHTTQGHYAADLGGFTSAVSNGPLTVEAQGGRYAYGPSSFPEGASNHNFWADVYFFPAS